MHHSLAKELPGEDYLELRMYQNFLDGLITHNEQLILDQLEMYFPQDIRDRYYSGNKDLSIKEDYLFDLLKDNEKTGEYRIHG